MALIYHNEENENLKLLILQNYSNKENIFPG